MTESAWEAVKREFAALLELDVEKRAARLSALHDSNAEIAAEVESLLAASDPSGEFLETPAAERAVSGAREEALPPERLGAWRVEAEIGRGGMGSVYRGRRADGAFEQIVAIKVVRRELASEMLRRRFLAERRILAALDHPNIARILDAGSSPDGAPYLVLEHVDGQPIDRYCEARALPIEARLALFARVCDAVHHAHQKLVLHRDIKAANVLVDERGEPKLLDFGIATLLTPVTPEPAEGGLTALGFARPLTPEWASPEQLRGEPLTTASDVYSLGVLLYLLLAGERPWRQDRESIDLFAARLESQPLPSVLATARRARPAGVVPGRIAGDLEGIVGKALEADPRRRYATARELGEDVERFVSGHPVAARAPTLVYRAGKWLRRNRTAAAAGAIVALSLLGATAFSLRQARVAEGERSRAQKRFDDVRGLANVVLFDAQEALASVPGALKARQLLVETSLRYLDDLAREAGDEPSLLAELASAYERVAYLQGTPNWPGAGRSGDALASLERALELRERIVVLATAPPESAAARKAQGKLLGQIGDVLAGRGETAAARERHLEAGRIYRALLADLRETPPLDLRRELTVVEVAVGDDTWELGDIPGAAERYRRALEQSLELRRLEPDSRVALRQSGVIHQRVGDAAAELEDWPTALEHYRASLVVDEELDRREPGNAETLRDLGTGYARMGAAAFAAKDFAAALADYRRAEALRERLVDADPGDTRALTDAAESNFQVAQALAALDQLEPARSSTRTALARWRDLVERDADNVRWRDSLALGLTDSARWEARIGDAELAISRLEEAVSLRRALAASHPDFASNARGLEDATKLLEEIRNGGAPSASQRALVPWR